MTADSMIISLPQRQSMAQRSLYTSLTAMAWVAWIALWLPLITAAAWAAGIDLAYSRVILENAAKGLDDLLFLLRAGTFCCVLFLSWALYNAWRYGGSERRGPVASVHHTTIADYFGANDIVSDRLRRMRRSVLHVDPSGRPVRAVVDPPARPAPPPLATGGDDEHGYDQRPLVSEHPEELAQIE